MSNLIDDIVISKSASDSSWGSLCMVFEVFNGETKLFNSGNESDRNEDGALSELLDNFAKEFSSESLRRKIIHEFRQLRENNLNRFFASSIILVAPEDQPKSHFSCKKTSNEDAIKQAQEKIIFFTLN